MLEAEQAKKVVVHIGEDQKYRGRAAFAAILEYLRHKRILTATITRGIAGFGADHQMHTINIERLTEDLPIQIEFVAPINKVDEIIPDLYEMAGTGLIEVQDTLLPVAQKFGSERPPVPRKREARAQLLRVFLGENDRCDGKPLFQAVIESMHANDIAGVTVYRGVGGYGDGGGISEGSIPLAGSGRPVTVTAIDEEQKIRAFLPYLERMIDQGLVVLSDVETVRYTHDFRSTDRRSGIR